MALRLEVHRFVGIEHKLAGGCSRGGGQALADDELRDFRIEHRMQQLIELGSIDAEHRLLLGDEPFPGHVNGDLERSPHAALAGAALQHPEPALLYRELDVLNVAEVCLEPGAGGFELGERLGHQGLERRAAVTSRFPRSLRQRLRRAQARDHVLALGVDQELAVELLCSG